MLIIWLFLKEKAEKEEQEAQMAGWTTTAPASPSEGIKHKIVDSSVLQESSQPQPPSLDQVRLCAGLVSTWVWQGRVSIKFLHTNPPCGSTQVWYFIAGVGMKLHTFDSKLLLYNANQIHKFGHQCCWWEDWNFLALQPLTMKTQFYALSEEFVFFHVHSYISLFTLIQHWMLSKYKCQSLYTPHINLKGY